MPEEKDQIESPDKKIAQKNQESKALIGPDHPKADLIARVFGKALCHGSAREPEREESSQND